MSGILDGVVQLLGGLLGSLTGSTSSRGASASVTQVSDVLGQLNQAVATASGVSDHIVVSALPLIPAQSSNAFGIASNALVEAIGGVGGGFQSQLGQTYYGLTSAFGLGGSAGAGGYLSGINQSSTIGTWAAKLTDAGMYAGQNIAALALSLPMDVAAATNPTAYMTRSNL